MSIFNVKDFYKRSPKLGYQFKVEFLINEIVNSSIKSYDNDSYVSRKLSTCVQSVTIPSIKMKSTPYVSRFLYNNIEYDFSDMTLSITFEESDDMIVNRLLMYLFEMQRPNYESEDIDTKKENGEEVSIPYKRKDFFQNSYMNTFIRDDKKLNLVNFLDIKVFEMDPGKNNHNNYTYSLVHVFRDCFVTKSENINMEYTESPKGVTLNVDFGFRQYYIANRKTEKIDDDAMIKLNSDDKLIDDVIEEYKYVAPELVEIDYGNLNTTDFDITDPEVYSLFVKLQKATSVEIDYKKFEEMLKKNAELMKTAYENFARLMESKGFKVTITDYNNNRHEAGWGTNSGSHTMGQKIDMNVSRADGEKLTKSNATKAERETINKLAEEAGLIVNWERDPSNAAGENSLWIDAALKEGYTMRSDGKDYESKKFDRWVENGKIRNVDKKVNEDFDQ